MLLCTVETQHNCRMIRFNSGYYFSVFNLIGTLTRNPVFSELTVWSSLSPGKVLFIWIPYSPNINKVKIQTKSLWLFTEQSRFQSKVTPKSSPTITFFFSGSQTKLSHLSCIISKNAHWSRTLFGALTFTNTYLTPVSVQLQLIITELVSKWARGINEQLLKTSGADVLSSREKLKIPQRGGTPPRSPRTSEA